MGLKINTRVADYLKTRAEQRFTVQEIALWILEAFPDECREKRERSLNLQSDEDLLQQLAREVYSQVPDIRKRHAQIRTTEERPRRYYWTEKTDPNEDTGAGDAEDEHDSNSSPPGRMLPGEADLYPLLCQYVFNNLKVFPRRIDEKKSTNRQGRDGNKWLWPDIVGMEDITADWTREIRDVVQEYADKKSKLWSFEVKRSISQSNVRSAFFQTVSNSSWANLAYLVAAEVRGAEAELQMLCSLHGIGFIQNWFYPDLS